ncbi:DUF3987 domain-containing protein [Nonomuraea sp. NPDC048892]|uniref:DUF3987 domain-containing protein n=1 Tax=Nonomuraea sp. NPDC048892 TaxID=3154624 RepID=UPI0033EB46A9
MSQHVVSARPQVSPIVFSGFLGKAVLTLIPHSEADPVGILASLLSAFSAAIDNGPRVHYGTQTQTLSTWTVLVGNTGQGRKGTATRAALDIVRTALPDWSKATILEGCPQSGPAYVSTLADMNGTALMLEEEFADLLKVSARYKSMGKALRRSWEGASISNRTKEAVIQVDAPHVAIVGNVTPTEWASSIGKADKAGGTLNRFLPLYVERSKKIKLSEQISADDWAALIRPLAREFRQAVMTARNTDEVTVSPTALKLWDDKLSELIDGLSIGREAMEQFAARAADYVWRLSALYALADQRDEITTQDLEAAVGLVAYMCDSVTYLTPELSGGQSQESLALKIEQFVKGAGEEGVPATLLYRKFSLRASELQAAVAGLPTIEVTKSQGGRGRPALIYRYVTPITNEEMVDESADIEAPELVTPEIEEISEPVSVLAPLTDDEWEVIDTPTVFRESVHPTVVPVLSDDEWEEIDAALSVTPEPETLPEPEPVAVATEGPAVTKEAVLAYLGSPEGAKLLHGILANMLTGKTPSAPQSAPENPVRTAQAVTVGQAGKKVAPVPVVTFQPPTVELVSAA